MDIKNNPTTALAAALVKIASITPDDLGCQDLLRRRLAAAGFHCETLQQPDCETQNLLALHGTGHPIILFLGHSDVVPAGPREAWQYDPFAGSFIEEADGLYLYGRGSADMKGSDAAMTEALAQFAAAYPEHPGTLALLITSNEEGDSKGGTPYAADLLRQRNLIPDYCIVGEPSAASKVGDTIKNGRRGSLTAVITVKGIQGHVAYPQRVKNAIHLAAQLICRLTEPLDKGSEFFPPTSFQVTNLQAGTGAENVAPGVCTFMCNWRFNSLQSKESIQAAVEQAAQDLKLELEIKWKLNGKPFLTKPGCLIEALSYAVNKHACITPKLSTAGGTSDGRFIAPLGAEVVECGPCSATIHQANEKVKAEDLITLTKIFYTALQELSKKA